MKLIPDAKMVDIRIVEVPYPWKGVVPERELGSMENRSFIKLVHEPTHTPFSVDVGSSAFDANQIGRLRAEAKLAFIKVLTGDA
ncbi:hypothetical protein [Nitrogeniibacter aestuarii]|uniref:hypothetical protein n=1 Tax=Nitrogeniibacter aestuarii TaxID=2815343 RepID=UPI001E4E9641|nr:hypothetical protein [Nitrogeniibacter aestuarii]